MLRILITIELEQQDDSKVRQLWQQNIVTATCLSNAIEDGTIINLREVLITEQGKATIQYIR